MIDRNLIPIKTLKEEVSYYAIHYYEEMQSFYRISELCELFGVTKEFLKKKSHEYEIYPVKIDGEYGFLKQAACSLHNKIYREEWLLTHGEGTCIPEPEKGDLPWL